MKRHKCNALMFPLLLFLSIVFWVVFPYSIDAKPLADVRVIPSVLFQGGVSRVEVVPSRLCGDITTAYFKGKTIPAKKMGNKYVIVIGAGISERPGMRRLELVCLSKDKRQIIQREIRVKHKEYPKEFLKVPKKMVSFSPKVLKRVLADQKAVKRACSFISRKIYWDGPFIWPVEKRITSPFGLRRYFNGKPRSPHSGVDLKATNNTPVLSPNAGRVVLVRDCYLSGKTLVIDHGAGIHTLYAHLNKINVRKGQVVNKGQVIALTGSTGRITGPHLHWGVSILGERVDPVSFMDLFGANGP